MFLDWLLKKEEDKISYDELKMLALKTDQDGVSEDGNLPYGRILQQQQQYTLQI